MDFSHYTDRPVQLAVALVNTDQRPVGGGDSLSDLTSLEDFLAGYAELWREATRPLQRDDLPKVRELRDRLRSVFEAPDPDTAVDEINRLLTDNVATPRLSTHSDIPHLHFEPLGTSVSHWLAVVTAMGLATVIIEDGVDRFGTCASDVCHDAFVDTTRNRSRRHCSSTCSTRENVAAYRRRQRAGA